MKNLFASLFALYWTLSITSAVVLSLSVAQPIQYALERRLFSLHSGQGATSESKDPHSDILNWIPHVSGDEQESGDDMAAKRPYFEQATNDEDNNDILTEAQSLELQLVLRLLTERPETFRMYKMNDLSLLPRVTEQGTKEYNDLYRDAIPYVEPDTVQDAPKIDGIPTLPMTEELRQQVERLNSNPMPTVVIADVASSIMSLFDSNTKK